MKPSYTLTLDQFYIMCMNDEIKTQIITFDENHFQHKLFESVELGDLHDDMYIDYDINIIMESLVKCFNYDVSHNIIIIALVWNDKLKEYLKRHK